MAQQKRSTGAPASDAAEGSPALDPVRLQQLLDLLRGLLGPDASPEETPAHLAHRVALFLGACGVALGVVEDARYRLLAVHGLDSTYHRRHHGLALRDSPVAPALIAGRPLVLAEDAGTGDPLHTVVLPFAGADVSGALHLVTPADRPLPPDTLALARAVAVVAGDLLAGARQRQRLIQLARLKSDALAAMAHDLRAPLNALVGYAGLLGDRAFGPLTAEQADVAAILERQALELVDLLGATLDVARLETGRLPVRIEEFALAEVLATLQAGTFARATRSGRLTVRVPAGLPPLHSDRVKVKEIVQNLVDNALKHGAQAPVEVDVTLVAERDTVRITVRDAGPGIAADVLPHLFEPFRSGEGRGTGFGLYLVRSFAEALRGRVAARSHAGEGTAITVELPLAARG